MSFSQETKESLSELNIKNKCCRHAYVCGKEFNSIENLPKIKCSSCTAHFLRGVFITHGSVTNPQKGYHVDISFVDEKARDYIFDLLEETGLAPKKSYRRQKGNYIVYFRESSGVEDFLALIGANKAAFDLMNSKILKEIRNNVNRAANCDSANIGKSISASKKCCEIIRELDEKGMLCQLSPELVETAKLRIENEHLSIAELGLICNPPVSKSGMNHRLTKIIEQGNAILEKTANR